MMDVFVTVDSADSSRPRIMAVLVPDVRYHLTLLHFWQLAIAVFWMTGGAS